ncbi:MAG: ferritin-like domain-containing protein [Chloroflexota bacterium]
MNFQSKDLSRRNFLKGSVIVAGASVIGLETFLNTTKVAAFAGPDIDILNYALTLEHLEYAFYRDGLNKFSTFAGSMAVPRGYLEAIRDHEKTHVDTLISVISGAGGTPVAEAKYSFGYTDPASFLKVAQALENTGVMAYTGVIAAFQDASLRTAASTIATVEARHASYLNLVNGGSPFPAAFDTPKSIEQILQIAGPFIVK